VQRAKLFAGMWGVPHNSLFAAEGGARTKVGIVKPDKVDLYVAEEI